MRNPYWLSLALIVALGVGAAEAQEKVAEIGKVVKDESLTLLDGKKASLSDYRNDEKGEGGKIVVLTFWSYKCPTGKRMMERNEKLAEYCRENDVVFLGVSSYGESKEQVKKYSDENKISYPIAFDGDQSITKTLGATCVSTTAILDKDGKLVYYGSLVSRKKHPETKENTPYVSDALKEVVAGKKVTRSLTDVYG